MRVKNHQIPPMILVDSALGINSEPRWWETEGEREMQHINQFRQTLLTELNKGRNIIARMFSNWLVNDFWQSHWFQMRYSERGDGNTSQNGTLAKIWVKDCESQQTMLVKQDSLKLHGTHLFFHKLLDFKPIRIDVTLFIATFQTWSNICLFFPSNLMQHEHHILAFKKYKNSGCENSLKTQR